MTRGGTDWRRFGMLAISASVGVAAFAAMLLLGVLPLGLYIIGQDLQIASDADSGTAPEGLDIYVDTQRMKNNGSRDPVAMARIPRMELPGGLCLSLALTFPVVGTNTIRVDFTGRTVARGVVLALADFRAGANTLTAASTDGTDVLPDRSNLDRPIRLGLDAAELGGPVGGFGVDLPGSAEITRLAASAKATVIAGTFRISGIRLPRIGHGTGVEHGACYRPGTP